MRLRTGAVCYADQAIVCARCRPLCYAPTLGRQVPRSGDAGQLIQVRRLPLPRPIGLHQRYGIVAKGNAVWLTGVHWPTENPSGADFDSRAATAQRYPVATDRFGCRSTVIRVWEGVRPRGAHGPIVGPVPGWDGLTVAAGHGSNGFLLSPVTATAVQAWICSGHLPSPGFAPVEAAPSVELA